MLKAMLAAVGLSAAILLGSGASARTISEFMDDCRSDANSCKSIVTSVIINGRDARYICVPKGMSSEKAAQQEIDWLKEKVGSSKRFANRDDQDALWDGAAALWPCKRR